MPVVQVCDGQSWCVQLRHHPPLMQNHIVVRAIVAVSFILTQTGYADGRLRVTSL